MKNVLLVVVLQRVVPHLLATGTIRLLVFTLRLHPLPIFDSIHQKTGIMLPTDKPIHHRHPAGTIALIQLLSLLALFSISIKPYALSSRGSNNRELCYIPGPYSTGGRVVTCETKLSAKKDVKQMENCFYDKLDMNPRPPRCEVKNALCEYHFVFTYHLTMLQLIFDRELIDSSCMAAKKYVPVSITLQAVDFDSNQIGASFFEAEYKDRDKNTNKLVVKEVIIKDSTISDTRKFSQFFEHQSNQTKNIVYDNVTFNQILPKRFLHLKSNSQLTSLTIRNSTLNGMEEEALLFEIFYEGAGKDKNRTLEVINTQFRGPLADNSIKLDRRVCHRSDFRFVFRESKLDQSFSRAREPIKIRTNDTPCESNTYFEFHDNDFAVMKESVFRNILNDSKSFSLNFIDCCDEGNKWLLDAGAKMMTDSKPILCAQRGNINGTVWMNIKEDLEKECAKSNSNLAVIIAIVTILAVAAILALFSWYCIYCVLPRRHNVVMINSQGKRIDSSDSASDTRKKPKRVSAKSIPSATAASNVNSSKTGVIQVSSTVTEPTHRQVPLMSRVGRKSDHQQVRVSSQTRQAEKLPPSSVRTQRSSLVETDVAPKQSTGKFGKVTIPTLGSKIHSTKSIKTITITEKPKKGERRGSSKSDRMSEALK